MINTLEKTPTLSFFYSSRFWMLAAVALVALWFTLSMQAAHKIDPVFSFPIIAIFMFGFAVLLKKSIINPVLPFMGLLLILFVIFFEKKFLSPFGLSLNLYTLVFSISAVVTLIQLVTDFKYYWNNFTVFKYLSVFLGVTILYLLIGYYSDFRLTSNFSTAYSHTSPPSIFNDTHNTREFGAFSQYVIWIEALIPLITVTTALSLTKIKESPETLVVSVMQAFVVGLGVHYGLAAFAPLIHTSYSYTSIGGLLDPGTNFVYPMFLMLLLGFKYYTALLPTYPYKKWTDLLLTADILYTLVLIASFTDDRSGSTSMVLALITGLPIIILGCRSIGLGLPFAVEWAWLKYRPILLDFFKFFFFVVILAGVFFYFLNRIGGASDNNTHSMSLRISHWRDIMGSWYHDLTLTRFFFGYGIDKVREIVYYTSYTSAVESDIQSPHNLLISLVYDYGAMGLIYLAGIFSTVWGSFCILKDHYQNKIAKLFSIINIAFVTGLFLMTLFLDMTLIIKIIFFAVLGLLEVIKFLYSREPASDSKGTF